MRARTVRSVAALTIAALALAGIVTTLAPTVAIAAGEPPTLSLAEGQVVSGTVNIAVGSTGGGATLTVDGSAIPSVDPSSPAAAVVLNAGSVSRNSSGVEPNRVLVNGTEVTVPAFDAGSVGGTPTTDAQCDGDQTICPLVTSSSFSGLLHPGENTITFVTLIKTGSLEPDQMHLKNLQLHLDGGMVIADPYTAAKRILVTYQAENLTTSPPRHYAQYAWNFTLPGATATWDSTSVADGEHTVTATDANGSTSVRVIVDNVADEPTINLGTTLQDGDVLSGSTQIGVTGDPGLTVRVDDGAPLATRPATARTGTVSFYGGSIASSGINPAEPYRLVVNGQVVVSNLMSTNAATPDTSNANWTNGVEYATEAFPASLLQPGENTIEYISGTKNSPVEPDRSYLTDLKLTLDDGTLYEDPTSKDARIQVDYSNPVDPPRYYAKYTWTLRIDDTPWLTRVQLDTRTLAEGAHTLHVADANESLSRTFYVDNYAPGASIVEGAVLRGTQTVEVTGDPGVVATIDGQPQALTPGTPGGYVTLKVGSTSAGWNPPNKVLVNGVEVNVPGLNSSVETPTAGCTGCVLRTSDAFPAGLLHEGVNTVTVVPGIKGDGNADQMYVHDLTVHLSTGATFVDTVNGASHSNGTGKHGVGYNSSNPAYRWEYPFDFTLGTDDGSWPKTFQLDTTALADGEHTLEVDDGTTPFVRAFGVDNTGPVVTVLPESGSVIRGESFTIEVTSVDARYGASPATITFDGTQIYGGETYDSERLENGQHTIVVDATDAIGNTTHEVVSFTTYREVPIAPVLVGPADGAVDVPASGTELSVTVSDPADDALDVDFKWGWRASVTDESVLAVRTGSSRDANPARGAGDEVAGAELGSLETSDEQALATVADEAYPFQQFDVSVPAGLSDEDLVELTWNGTSEVDDRVVLKAWNHVSAEWELLDAATEAGDGVRLSGRAEAGEVVSGGVATLLVQVEPGYIAPSTDGVTKFAWITDTQIMPERSLPAFENLNRYIADNWLSEEWAYVVHTGDIVNVAAEDFQWENADVAMQILDDAGIPYGVVSGNHDYETGYSHYRKWFGEDRFADKPWYGGTISDNVQHYDYVSTPEADYMFLYLTWSATPAEWQWVKDEIAAHPEANVIIGTHEQFADVGVGLGSPAQLTGQGTRFMDEIILPNENVVAILSGHKRTSYVWIHRFEDGRVVLQVQGNYQSITSADRDYTTGVGVNGYMRTLTLDVHEQTFQNDTFTIYDTYSSAGGGKTHAWPELGCEPQHLGESGMPSIEDEMTEACQEAENFKRDITLSTRDRSFATDRVEINAYGDDVIRSLTGVASGSTVAGATGELAGSTEHLWYAEVTDDRGVTVTSPMWSFTTAEAPVVPGVVPGTIAISGDARVGGEIVASPSGWSPESVAYRYQWYRGGIAVPGATSASYIPAATDAGKWLSVRVVGSAPEHDAASLTSTRVQIGHGAISAGAPSLGMIEIGAPVAVDPGTWSGPAGLELAYQWYRGGIAIAGATSASYSPSVDDLGAWINVRVTGAAPGYATATATTALGKVERGKLVGGTPVLSAASVGTPVTLADDGSWGPGAVTVTYKWFRGGVQVAGETGATYTPVASDRGKWVNVRIVVTRPGFESVAVSSALVKVYPAS